MNFMVGRGKEVLNMQLNVKFVEYKDISAQALHFTMKLIFIPLPGSNSGSLLWKVLLNPSFSNLVHICQK